MRIEQFSGEDELGGEIYGSESKISPSQRGS